VANDVFRLKLQSNNIILDHRIHDIIGHPFHLYSVDYIASIIVPTRLLQTVLLRRITESEKY